MAYLDRGSGVTNTPMPPPDTTPKMLWGIIGRPARTLARLRDHPENMWLTPVILAMLLLIARALVTVPIADYAADQALEQQLSQMTPEGRAQIGDRISRSSSLNLRAATGIVSGLIGLWVRWLFRAGVIHAVSLGLGGRNRFTQVFTMVLWTWMPLLARTLLQTLSIAFNGTLPAHQGLVAYLAAMGQTLPSGTQYTLLSQAQLDVFTLWSLMLLGLGVYITTELSKAKAVAVTAGYWALATALSLAPTFAGQLLLSRFLPGQLGG